MKISRAIVLFAMIATTTVVCSNTFYRGLHIVDANGNTGGNSGRLEVHASINGVDQYGSVCDDAFNDNSANTACRSLGFEGAISWSGNGLIPELVQFYLMR
eukprot:c19608_g1_i2.p1 GENE.c19608_g1_i2~~c19608_g1_i2.p1  ORF type:complete len:101 (+),score=30.73 c19608_g1_i2:42-344(+)